MKINKRGNIEKNFKSFFMKIEIEYIHTYITRNYINKKQKIIHFTNFLYSKSYFLCYFIRIFSLLTEKVIFIIILI